MLDNILNLVKNTVSNTVGGSNDIPDEKKSQTIEATTHAVGNGLKENFTLSNMSNLVNLFKGGTSTSNNPVTNNIAKTVTNELMQKVGLSSSVANMISGAVVPMVMGAIAGKVNDPNEKGFNLESLIGTFSGNNHGQESGLLGSLGKMFGK